MRLINSAPDAGGTVSLESSFSWFQMICFRSIWQHLQAQQMTNRSRKDLVSGKSVNDDQRNSMEPGRKKNNLLLPHRCSWAPRELPRWADLWLEGELLFDVFQHRWSYICETLRAEEGDNNRKRCESTSSKSMFPKTTHSWWWAMKRWVNRIMRCGEAVRGASRKTLDQMWCINRFS